MSLRTVCFLLLPHSLSLDVTGPYEVFAGANKYQQALGQPPAYRLQLAAWGARRVPTESGLLLQADCDFAALRGALDTLILPGGDGCIAATQDAALLQLLRRRAARARRVAAVCTGAFVFAAAGLLDGRRATTHWAYCRELAQRFPQVQVEPDPIFLQDGPVWTSAGVTAGMDLALALVEADLGREAALTIARWLVLFLRRPASQRQFSDQLHGQMAEREALRRLQAHIADHLDEDLGVERLAQLAAMSPRHFARCFRQEIGLTPARYVAQQRLEAARQRLEEGSRPVEAIARDCGFGTAETLRRAFVRELHTPPREYRRRFHSPAASTQ